MKLNYKVLMAGNIFVDCGRLHKGIYETAYPFLRSEDDTLEAYIQRLEDVKVEYGWDEKTEAYYDAVIENAKKCIFATVEVTLKVK